MDSISGIQDNSDRNLQYRYGRKDIVIKYLKEFGYMSSGIILNKVVPLFFATKFVRKPRSPPYFDLISNISNRR